MNVSLRRARALQRSGAGAPRAVKLLERRRATKRWRFGSQSTAGLSLLMKRFGIAGYASSVHTACASGGQAIGTALRVIRRGVADRALAGGFDSMVSPVGLAGFCLLSAVSTDNDTPERASRPFDATRTLSDGQGPLVDLRAWDKAVRAARASTRSSGATATRLLLPHHRSHPGEGPIRRASAPPPPMPAQRPPTRLPETARTSKPMKDRSERRRGGVFGEDRKVAVSRRRASGHYRAAVRQAVSRARIHRSPAAEREP